MSKNKRVLITGITGMVGSHLADYLLDNTDWEIFGMTRWRSPLDNIENLVPYINQKTTPVIKIKNIKRDMSFVLFVFQALIA